jgi:DNA polymerase-3 subunit gamma/tau
MFRALVREIEDLAWAPQPAALLEMAVVRLATLPAGDDVAQLLARLDQLERRLAQQGGPGHPGGSGGGPAPPPGGGPRGAVSGRRPQASAPPRRKGRGADAAEGKARSDGPHVSNGAAGQAGPASPAAAPKIAPEPSPAASATVGLGGGAAPEMLFDRLRARALETDRARFASLDVARLIVLSGETLELGVPGSFHADRLRARQSEIEALATDLFGQPLRIAITVQEAQASQGQEASQRELSRRRRQQALHSEPVNLALEVLEAQIVEIRPLGDSR